jgi:predicted heme/steroid binding protein
MWYSWEVVGEDGTVWVALEGASVDVRVGGEWRGGERIAGLTSEGEGQEGETAMRGTAAKQSMLSCASLS